MWGKGLSPRGVRKNAGAGQGKVKGRTPSRGKARRSARAEVPGDREGKQALGEAVDSRAIAPHTPREPPAEGLISFTASRRVARVRFHVTGLPAISRL